MRRRTLGTAVALLLLSASLASAAPKDEDRGEKPREEKNAPYPPSWRVRVTKTVDRAVAYLKKEQRADGSWAYPTAGVSAEARNHRLGYTALMTLALVKGGTPADDPAVQKALAYLRPLPIRLTYDAGVLLMLLHALYAPDEDAFAAVDRYGAKKGEDPCLTKMTKADRDWMKKGVAFLLENQEDGHWRYPGDGLDLSNTQYALLGLWAASRCGMKIKQKVWLDSLNWMLGYQEHTGRPVRLLVNEVRGDYRVVWEEPARARGFRYRPENTVTGSMTTAGMAGIAICQDELWKSRKFVPKLRRRVRKSIRDAMAWMQDNFDVTKNPGEPGGKWHFYYLYGMERAGILARFRFFGKYDWYKLGADWLMANQDSLGRWNFADPRRDTAFAILFLERSTMRSRLPAITPREE